MEGKLIKEGRYSYFEVGEGPPIVVLHGLMGGLSNFKDVANYFSTKGYKIIETHNIVNHLYDNKIECINQAKHLLK